jgi:CheY-like chemotaxis protein
VLVVDDDPAVRSVVVEAPEAEGRAVLEALGLVRTAPVALVLLDVDMPVLDGPGFVRAYRAGPGPHAPVVLMTASEAAQRWARVLGAGAVLAKPFALDDLCRVVAA